MLRRCVWSRNLVNEEAIAHWGLLGQKQNIVISILCMQFAVQNKRMFPKISPSSIRIVSVFARKAFYNVSVYGIRLNCIFCGFFFKPEIRQNKA